MSQFFVRVIDNGSKMFKNVFALRLPVTSIHRQSYHLNRTQLFHTTMSNESKIFVAVVGVGLVGSELINQLLAIPPQSSPFHLISVTSSTRSLFTPKSPITSSSWKSNLSSSPEKADLDVLTKQLAALVAPAQKVAIVDNTSSDDVAALYPAWLQAGISVITPNKKAYSGDLSLYEKIVNASTESGAKYLNESTVGAGLPVVSTLKELVITGDKVCIPVKPYSCPIKSD